jgi:hypothetical protein
MSRYAGQNIYYSALKKSGVRFKGGIHTLRQNAEARKMPNEGVCTVFAAQLLTAGSALFDVFSSPVEARRYDYERNIQISECGPSPPRRSAWYPCGCV